jgi:hypothetical protein
METTAAQARGESIQEGSNSENPDKNQTSAAKLEAATQTCEATLDPSGKRKRTKSVNRRRPIQR